MDSKASILVLALLLVAYLHAVPGVKGAHTINICDEDDIVVIEGNKTVDGQSITLRSTCPIAGCPPQNIRVACEKFNPRNVLPPSLIHIDPAPNAGGTCIINDGGPLVGEITFVYQQDEPVFFLTTGAQYPCCATYEDRHGYP